MNIRAVAASVIAEVAGGRKTLDAALESALPRVPKENDRSLVQALCYGVLRWYFRLERVLETLTRKPIKDPEIQQLALLGLYQLRYTRVKPHAAVAETVAAAGAKAWAKPLLNAILRRYQRESEQIEAAIGTASAAATAHPQWLYKALKQDWPERLDELLAANNAAPPMVLRVNTARGSREEYLGKLQAAEIPALPCRAPDTAILLETPVPVSWLPGFAEGEVSVQDSAAQLAADLMGLDSTQRVLDVCAAPGGKTLHMLESCPELAEMVAVDLAADRLAKISENLARAGLKATLIAGDAGNPEAWWDGRPFDRILVDAPCSATGVIRRHPDIKVRRQAADVDDLVALQKRILGAVWPMLATGGLLLYATCSVLRRENELQVGTFLENHADARERTITADWGFAVTHGRQILPGDDGMDGFFYACLEKIAPCSAV